MIKKWILSEFVRSNYIKYIIGIFALIVTGISQTLIPKLLGSIIDSLENRSETIKSIFFMTLWMLLLSVFIFLLKFVWRYFIVGRARDLECFLRAKLFGHLQTLPVRFFNKKKTGDLMSYATNDLSNIRQAFAFGIV